MVFTVRKCRHHGRDGSAGRGKMAARVGGTEHIAGVSGGVRQGGRAWGLGISVRIVSVGEQYR
jgi:hypothetical protein